MRQDRFDRIQALYYALVDTSKDGVIRQHQMQKVLSDFGLRHGLSTKRVYDYLYQLIKAELIWDVDQWRVMDLEEIEKIEEKHPYQLCFWKITDKKFPLEME